MPHPTSSETTVAILGGNTASGAALALLLKDAGYHTRTLEAPLAPLWRRRQEQLRGVDLLLLSSDLSAAHTEESLAVLRADEELFGMPVLKLSSDSEDLFCGDGEVGIVPWPCAIQRLTQEIEAALASSVGVEARECG